MDISEVEDFEDLIVFEDDHLMIINKPRGLVVHEGAGTKGEITLAEILRELYNYPVLRDGIVHRIDRNTAGLLIVAKTQDAFEKLCEMMREHKIRREYVGLVDGVVNSHGSVRKNIKRSTRQRTLFVTCGETEGKTAVTHYEVVWNFKKFTLLRFILETGRTHQIRVHMKSIGHPLVGDPEYNPGGKMSRGIGQMLESVYVSFVHPITGEDVEVEIDPTDEMLEQLGKCGDGKFEYAYIEYDVPSDRMLAPAGVDDQDDNNDDD
jgi:23S rRNA pseudouridine1911/1915/1917 synthase